MGNLYTRVDEIMDKIYNNNSPVKATALEEELAKKLQENFGESYKKALSEIDITDDSMEVIPSPGQIVDFIEQLPEADQEKYNLTAEYLQTEYHWQNGTVTLSKKEDDFELEE